MGVDVEKSTHWSGKQAVIDFGISHLDDRRDVPLLPRLGTVVKPDGKHLTLTYQRPKNSGITYTAQLSVTLAAASWLSGNAVFQELPPLDLGDGTESVTVEDLNPISSTSRAWLRLRVSK